MKEIGEKIEKAEHAGVFIYPTIVMKEEVGSFEEIVFIANAYNDGFDSNPERRSSEALGEANQLRETGENLKGGE